MKKHSTKTRKIPIGIPQFGVVSLLVFSLFCSPTAAKRSSLNVNYSNDTQPSLNSPYNENAWTRKISSIWFGIDTPSQKLGFVYEQEAPISKVSKDQQMNVALKDILDLSSNRDWHNLDITPPEVSLNDHQPSVSDPGAPLGLSTYLSHAVNDRISFSPYFHHDRNSSGPDIGLGVQMSFKL
jgi:hypothetical protein